MASEDEDRDIEAASHPPELIGRPSKPRYSPLSIERQEIRLLTLLSGGFEEAIRCELGTVSLDPRPNFAALSYCWGDQHDLAEIVLGEQSATVTGNLETALRYWRSTQEDLVIWVDALCINQEDLAERSSQVCMMGNIYTSASYVRIWLGESSCDSDVAMDFLNNIDTIDFEDPGTIVHPDTWVALKKLLRRKWWTRLWVVQEALLARAANFYCGRREARLEQFIKFKELHERHKWDSRAHLQVLQSHVSGPLSLLLWEWKDLQAQISNGGSSLSRMITSTRECQYSEPLDRIFALLSVCTELDRRVIRIDYTMSIHELLIQVAKYLLISRWMESPLFYLQSHQVGKHPSLPSWVPDFTTPDEEGHIIAPVLRAGADNDAWASLGLAPCHPNGSLNSLDPMFEDGGLFETLVVPGLIFADISAAFKTPWVDFYEGFDLDEERKSKLRRREAIIGACKEWEAYIQQLGPDRDPYAETCGRYEAFWRTLITNGGLSMFHDPVTAEWDFAGRFEAWMGRRENKLDDEAYIRPYNNAAVTRCMWRSFFVTGKGYLGLGPRSTRASDLVCILRGGNVPFVLRLRDDGCYDLVGEAYVHGVMDGSFVRGAKREDLKVFRLR